MGTPHDRESLTADSVTLRRRGLAILADVSITIRPGEIVAIIGANGAGKSTLLQVLAGELMPQRGRVRLLGRLLSTFSRMELARRRATVRPAQPVEFPFLVEELVALGRHPHGHDAQADRQAIHAALAFADVQHLASRMVASLSTGERQRVELARALTQLGEPRLERPTWLLLDEPTANLDLAHALILLERLRDRARAGVGIAMVVHDLGFALRFADRFILLARGRVLADAAPHVLALRPDLLRDGFGLEADIVKHPRGGWPVVLPTSAAPRTANHDPS